MRKRRCLIKRKKGQIWIETVLYTLIALGVIALALAFIQPKIKEAQDRIVIEQTQEALNRLDDEIQDIWRGGAGNVRNPEITLKRGNLVIDSQSDSISYVLEDSNVMFTEPGVSVIDGKINITTIKKSRGYQVILKLDYRYDNKIDITFEDSDDTIETLTNSPTAYKLSLSNEGISGTNPRTIINIKII